MSISAEASNPICREISDPSSPYLFDEIPISILGSIYERFLGKVVHATPKRADVEDKPEVRKAGGVYYTPEYIVRYIVQNTVGKLLRGENPPLEKGVARSAGGFNKTPEEISQMAFADIACGSGSFLIEVYSELLDYHTRYYSAYPEKAKPGDTQMREGKVVLSLKKRQEILTNNIYGVDIDYQATEVTQLSLYLKLLEDVTMNDAYQFSLVKEKILPDLKQNIVCGNSLIGTDILEGDLFEKTEERKLNPMNFADAFPKVMRRGGFDAIVGNPPYVQSRSERLSETEKNYYMQKYLTAEYQLNTFGLFLEKAHKVVRQGSLLGMIIPNYWLSTRYDLKLRKFLAIENSIVEILNVYNVFAEATVDTVVLLSERPHKNNFPKTFKIKSVDRNLKNIVERLNSVQSETWSFQHAYLVNEGADDINVSFAKTVELSGQDTIEKYFILKFGMKPYEEGKGTPKQTRQMMQKKVYDSTKKIDKSYMPLLRARNVNRYSINWEGDWIKYGDNLAAPRTFELFVGDRILIQRIVSSDRLFGTFVKDTFICNTDVITLKPKLEFDNFNILFFVGVLLSSAVGFYLKSRNVNLDRAAFPKINTETLGYLPIPKINFSDPADKSRHDHIVKLVEQMLQAKEKLASAKLESEKDRLELLCSSLDRQIDEAVFELYGLTPEEIKVVEGEKP